jgi:micrococcal nuclease
MIRTLLVAALSAFAMHTFGGQQLLAQARDLIEDQAGTQKHAGDAAVVERVLDGDTVILRGDSQRVRLANIDAPEMSHGYGKPGQPFSVQATKWLERKIEGKEVILRCPDQDRYGRRVCVLFLNGEDVNKQLVEAGLAWANTANPRYLRDKTVLDAQHEAQRELRGLWSQPHPTPPWLWRRECWEKQVCAPDL